MDFNSDKIKKYTGLAIADVLPVKAAKMYLACLEYMHEAFGDNVEYERLSEQMGRFDISVTSSWSDNIELMKRGAGKGKALRAYADRYLIPKDEIMTFGDQINDMDLLAASGWPVAMENAVEGLKKAAKLIAPHHDASGVGKIIRKYVLDEGETV